MILPEHDTSGSEDPVYKALLEALVNEAMTSPDVTVLGSAAAIGQWLESIEVDEDA